MKEASWSPHSPDTGSSPWRVSPSISLGFLKQERWPGWLCFVIIYLSVNNALIALDLGVGAVPGSCCMTLS